MKTVKPILFNWLILVPISFFLSCFSMPVAQVQSDTITGNRYWIAGIDNPAAFESTFRKIQQLVREEDKDAVAEYIHYPINVTIDGVKREIRDKGAFIANYEKIMTLQVKQAFINQKVEETFVNYQGVMVGNGEIWFGATDTSPQIYFIKAINN